jgi:AcrR family transcriptional regulator
MPIAAETNRPAERAPGRPRSTASRQAVMAAAYTILCDVGLSGFSVDAVSACSGVARTTIYRNWPTKGLLAFDSFLDSFRSQLAFAQSGDAEADLRALVASLSQALSGPAGRLAASVVAEAQKDATIQRQFLTRFSEPLRARSTEVIAAGVASSVFRADLDIPRLLDAAVGAVYLRLLFGQALDEGWAEALSDTLLKGCR